MAMRRRFIASPSPAGAWMELQTRSLTNSRIASLTLSDAAMADTHDANDELDPSAMSHMERNAFDRLRAGVVG